MATRAVVYCDDCVRRLGRITRWMDLVVVDPPYNQGVDYGGGVQKDKLSRSKYMSWCRQWIVACCGVLAPEGSFWVVCPDEYAGFFDWAMLNEGLHRRNWVVWYETFGVNCTRKFNRTKRHLLYYVANPKQFTFNRSAVSRPSDRQMKYNDKRANPKGKLLDDVWLDIPRLAGTHGERIAGVPTQLPIKLLDRIVRCCSNRDDMVLDPMCGSGTTGVAAVLSGRRFVGVERQYRFACLAQERIQEVGVKCHLL